MIFYQILSDHTYESLGGSEWPQIWSQVTPNSRMPDLKILIFPMAFELCLTHQRVALLKEQEWESGIKGWTPALQWLDLQPQRVFFSVSHSDKPNWVFRAMILNAKMLWGEKGVTQKTNSSCRMGTCAISCYTRAFLLYLWERDSLGISDFCLNKIVWKIFIAFTHRHSSFPKENTSKIIFS